MCPQTAEKDRTTGEKWTAALTAVVFAVYLFAPSIWMMPLKVRYGWHDSWPSSVLTNVEPFIEPLETVAGVCPPYREFVRWQFQVLWKQQVAGSGLGY